MADRKYLPTFADLVDRLCITQMKAIFIPERQGEYVEEMSLIMHDIDLILESQAKTIAATDVRAMLVLMLSNRFIWENETKARAGGTDQDKLLKLTHSINGVRNTAKNALAHIDGGRRDFKTDCFAAELVADFGNWNVFGVQNGEARWETDQRNYTQLADRRDKSVHGGAGRVLPSSDY
jgi:hypothetical protein